MNTEPQAELIAAPDQGASVAQTAPQLSTVEGKLNADKRVLALLQASSMTAKALVSTLRYDRCTVYRTLSKLRALGLISTRRMDARARLYLCKSAEEEWDKTHQQPAKQLTLF